MTKKTPPEKSVGDIFREAQQIERELTSQSDRHVALIGALALENQLETILTSMFVDGILPNGSKNFSNKIEWNFRLGLISSEEHKEIDLIRQVRNKMAHELNKDAFEEPSVKTLCNRLTYCEKLYVGEGLAEYFTRWSVIQDEQPCCKSSVLPKEYVIFPYGDDPRQRFIASIKALTSALNVRKLLAQREPVTSPMPFEHGVALYEGKNRGLQNSLRLLPPARRDSWRQAIHHPLIVEHRLVNLIASSRAHYECCEERQE